VTDFLVRRDDLRIWRSSPGEECKAAVPAGRVQLRVERFALTANSVSYALLGESLGYWDFFPGPPDWGRIPAWGFAEVVASGVEGMADGDRFYGNWPMSTFVTLEARATGAGFVECSAARAHLAPIYQRYQRAGAASGFAPEHDDAAALARPLFLTGWLIADQLAAGNWHGADAVVLTSASSKTAFATAWSIRRLGDPPALIGLTSDVAFTKSLGLYDQVLSYDEIAVLPVDRRTVLVDVAGNPDVRRELHERLPDVLCASIMVGATHWQGASLAGQGLPGPQPGFFFAPTVAAERATALGPAVFAARVGEAWAEFAARLPQLIDIEQRRGVEALAAAYTELVDGIADPRRGLVFAL
jgi:hypothetical protein